MLQAPMKIPRVCLKYPISS